MLGRGFAGEIRTLSEDGAAVEVIDACGWVAVDEDRGVEDDERAEARLDFPSSSFPFPFFPSPSSFLSCSSSSSSVSTSISSPSASASASASLSGSAVVAGREVVGCGGSGEDG